VIRHPPSRPSTTACSSTATTATPPNCPSRSLRDILAVEIADGTAQIQKIIIARELFGPEFVPYSR
jgi:hypothetical protein